MRRGALEAVLGARAEKQSVAVVTRLADGAQALVRPDRVEGDLTLGASVLEEVRRRLASGRTGMLEGEGGELFVRTYVPPLRLLVVGAVHVTQTLAPMAALAGFEVVVIDPRRAFGNEDRFPGVTMTNEWPEDALSRIGIDPHTAVVTLTHDPKIDDPTLIAALRSDAFYVGALGSPRTHAKRVARLTEQGLADAIPRIHAPIGLDLGGRAPAEIAVSILGQIIQVRHRGAAASTR
jgi:xanthine dehydrogenase accessory factor